MFNKQYLLGIWVAVNMLGYHLLLPAVARGQVVPDGTTPTPNPGACVPSCTIQGGTADITNTNLFHSFEQFSIPNGGTVIFDHDLSIQNILTRVTGNDSSFIDGFLRTIDNSEANVFLINPNSITFGPSGGLDIGGSFVATTAEALQFGGQGNFSTTDTTNDLTLLTISPSAFIFNQTTPQPIVSQSIAFDPANPIPLIDGLKVQEDMSLLLVGGDVILQPADSNPDISTRLQAPGGRIELGGLNSPGIVNLDINGKDLSLSYADNAVFSDITISGAQINLLDGDFVVSAETVSLNNSFINSETVGSENAGTVLIKSGNSVEFQTSSISSNTNTDSTGQGGDITILAEVLSLDEGSGLTANTSGSGDAGRILLSTESLSLKNISSIASEAVASNNASTDFVGNPGEIKIETNSLSLSEGSFISTLTSSNTENVASLGIIKIDAQDISLTDESLITSETRGQRNASDIEISTANLLIDDSSISADVNKQDDPRFEATGQGGVIDITAQVLSLNNNAAITSSTFDAGDAGDVLITNAETVTVSGDSAISASSTSTGSAGNVSLQINGQLRVQNGGTLEVSASDTGDSGMLDITANTIILNNGDLLASVAAGEDGNITLNLNDVLILRNDSSISAQAFTNANGGNVDITAPFIIALFPSGPDSDGNDIIASAQGGNGGLITIQTNSLFNIAENKATDGNRTNDIDASSDAGIDGEVIITNLDVPPLQSDNILSNDIATPDIDQGCQTGSNGQFTNAGRGGLPTTPYDLLSSDNIQEDIYPASQTIAQTAPKLIEAQGWGRDPQGNVVLLAENPTLHSSCQRTLTGAS